LDTFSFLNFFLSVGKWAPTVDSGPLLATVGLVLPLAETSSYATGLKLNFPE